MFKAVHLRNLLTRNAARNAVKRFFLSKAYQCEEAWSNRLKAPVFSKIDINNMYHDLDVIFQSKQRVSVVDVDLLLNGINDPNFKNEVEDVLLKIRLCPECSILPERATHAAVRYLMTHSGTDDLLNALSDRINYGLFPNHHLTNVLMDKYLKEKDSCSAVKIAVLQMLQEDFDHPIMKPLALYCCYNYLHSPDIWQIRKEADDADEEPVKVRVRFVRNPYFDDHFDIQVPNHLVGKTLWLFGKSLGGTLGESSQLIGLVLYEKYEKCAEFLEKVISSKTKVYAEAVEKAKEYAIKKPKQEVEGEGGAVEEGAEGADEHKKKVLELLNKLDGSMLVEGSLLKSSEELVKEMVKENEKKDINMMCETYKKWEEERENDIEAELKRIEKQRAMKEVEMMKEELKEKEETLFFFDKEDEIELVAAKHLEQKKSLPKYKLKGKEKALSSEDYIPPNV